MLLHSGGGTMRWVVIIIKILVLPAQKGATNSGANKILCRMKCVRKTIFRNVEVRVEGGEITSRHIPWVIVQPVKGHLTAKMNITFFITIRCRIFLYSTVSESAASCGYRHLRLDPRPPFRRLRLAITLPVAIRLLSSPSWLASTGSAPYNCQCVTLHCRHLRARRVAKLAPSRRSPPVCRPPFYPFAYLG